MSKYIHYHFYNEFYLKKTNVIPSGIETQLHYLQIDINHKKQAIPTGSCGRSRLSRKAEKNPYGATGCALLSRERITLQNLTRSNCPFCYKHEIKR